MIADSPGQRACSIVAGIVAAIWTRGQRARPCIVSVDVEDKKSWLRLLGVYLLLELGALSLV